MKSYKLYIGANNWTGELEKEKMHNVLIKYGENGGYTPIYTRGTYMGKEENTAIVEISMNPDKLDQLIDELKTELCQKAIGYCNIPSIFFK
jgi:hypothetical protein